MAISPIPPQQPHIPLSAEESLLELTKEMMLQIEKLKEALSKEKINPNLIKDPAHLEEMAKNVIALDKVSSQTQKLH